MSTVTNAHAIFPVERSEGANGVTADHTSPDCVSFDSLAPRVLLGQDCS